MQALLGLLYILLNIAFHRLLLDNASYNSSQDSWYLTLSINSVLGFKNVFHVFIYEEASFQYKRSSKK